MTERNYITHPGLIEVESFTKIRELTDLSGFNEYEEQMVMRVVHSMGMPEVAKDLRFSDGCWKQALYAIKNKNNILCDTEMVKQGVTKHMIKTPPLCFINDPEVADKAKENEETRSMAALELWKGKLSGSAVLIGNAPTALFRLLEMIEAGGEKPAIIIALPVGFIGAEESKQALWDTHKELGVECVTLLGRLGGSAATSAVFNALLRYYHGILY